MGGFFQLLGSLWEPGLALAAHSGLPDGPGESMQPLPGSSVSLCVQGWPGVTLSSGTGLALAVTSRGIRAAPPQPVLMGLLSLGKQTPRGCSGFSKHPLIKLGLLINYEPSRLSFSVFMIYSEWRSMNININIDTKIKIKNK